MQSCYENPSYFSEKCSRCQFSCLKGGAGGVQADSTSRGSISIPGFAAVATGAAAAVAGYPTVSSGLTVVGAAIIVAKILRK
ncbi:hypothetical protein [Noviherbaspirillum denitrificans]|uniref:Uncharacterized protein n=1 Tax=Noviherbaspirillum denitrificans TaxID=1968433 RepID=A0A254TEJ2_9BURK|nr:hypothetical protein [Noviherbaspirillum denitrificans]OWW20577.1 hypothetical protein AYR66_14850 [Noviherbaspirillum denitrificans]